MSFPVLVGDILAWRGHTGGIQMKQPLPKCMDFVFSLSTDYSSAPLSALTLSRDSLLISKPLATPNRHHSVQLLSSERENCEDKLQVARPSVTMML